MGSISLPIFKKILVFSSFICLCQGLFAKEIADIKLNEELKCGEIMLPLKGAALRTATIFGIKVYVVSYYAKKFIDKNMDPHESERPLCFEITYLRDFDNEDVDKAWEYQFKESSDFPYPNLKSDVNKLKEFFGEIKGERKHLFELTKDKTRLYENRVLKGEILGKDFQKNFLSIWYGKNPPTDEVKEELLKGL